MTRTQLDRRQVGLALLLLVVAVVALQPTTNAIKPSNTFTLTTSTSSSQQTVSAISYSSWLQSLTQSLTQSSGENGGISQTTLTTTTSDPVTTALQQTTTSGHDKPRDINDSPGALHQDRSSQ